ncbi:hypothetical protein [Streptomyces sp. NPDC002692]
MEDAGAAAAGVDHDRAELGALGADVLGNVIEGVALDDQVGGISKPAAWATLNQS